MKSNTVNYRSLGADGSPSLRLQVFVSPVNAIGDSGLTFSPTTSSLIYGEREVILADAQYLKRDVDSLGDTIEALGRTLTTIFVTHGHADHYFGIGELQRRFPGARAVATPKVAADIAANGAEQIRQFSGFFGEDLVIPTSVPDPLDDSELSIEGLSINVIDVEQADISPTSVLHVPQLDAIIAGDLAYNGIHQMLALAGPAEWDRWLASIESIAALRPRTVVAGHKNPEVSDDDGEAILNDTRDYIRNFSRLAAETASADDLLQAMQGLYPDHGNLTTLILSAHVAKSQGSINDFI
ncbi:MBL fold metallo-hydrolase [Mycobacterium colombiense]|uniref:MBL fold metallo-hydrolase n=1 Tax=Mycobacterium colombiense TaxID=339268 RepID=UPI00200A7975|nr:MBL fold metallo-hydrolase [Mycobacterium colombiense]MCK8642407.1 MBL fold metallo-hydrolase [Mycobacterium colombiense]